MSNEKLNKIAYLFSSLNFINYYGILFNVSIFNNVNISKAVITSKIKLQ